MQQANPDLGLWVYQQAVTSSHNMRLFCLPYAGSGAAIYRLWPEELPPDVELCRIQLPGRESRLREMPYNRLSKLVDELAKVIRPLLDVPFAFFGHSMGALVSFELARAVRREYGVTPEHLFVSAWRAPQQALGTCLHQLPNQEFIEEMQARFSGIPNAILQEREILDIMLPILRADLAVCETYEYSQGEPLTCPISVFGGLEDHWIRPSDLEAWSAQTSADFNVQMYPGDHFFINDHRRLIVQNVAQVLLGRNTQRDGTRSR